MIDLFQGPHATLFAAVGALAIANGVLVVAVQQWVPPVAATLSLGLIAAAVS